MKFCHERTFRNIFETGWIKYELSSEDVRNIDYI